MADQYANCTVSHKMHADRRFDLLAELAGWSRPEACWRMVELWARCTALKTDRPPAEVIRIHLGLRGEQHLIDAVLAERTPDGGVRVLGGGLTGGDTDRFGWYAPIEQRNAAGGRARADQVRREGRAAGGKFAAAGSSVIQRPTSDPTSVTSDSPASTSNPPASGFRIPDPEKISLSACAIPPTPVHGGEPGTRQPGPRATQQGAATPGQGATAQGAGPAAGNVAEPQIGPTSNRAGHPPSTGTFSPDDPRARGRLAEATYRRVSDALVAIAAELKLPPPLPFPAITPGSHPQSLRELQDRVREEGAAAPLVCDRVVANLIAQAREERSVEWLAEKAFSSRPWAAARQWTPGAAARRRGPARGDPLPPAPAPKRPERTAAPIKRTAEEIAELAAMADLAAEDPRAAVAELAAKLDATARAPPRSAAQDPPDQQPHTKAST